MANNYIQYSITIPSVKPAGAAFLEAHYAAQQARVAGDPDNYPDEGTYEFSIDKPFKGGLVTAYVYSEGEGSVEAAVLVLEQYLKKFNRKGFFILEWAFTCSKPRPGEFGGGAALVTAAGITWFTPRVDAEKLAQAKGLT